MAFMKRQVLSSLPPLPEGGEVDERTVVTDDAKGTSRPKSEVIGSQKSAASSERETESDASESVHSLPSAASPRNRRKRGDVEDSGTSKPGGSPAEETAPEEEEAFNPYEEALVSSDEEEEPDANVTAPTSTSQTLVLSETRRAAKGTSPPQQDLEMSTPATSPRAPTPKRARIELGKEPGLLAGSSTPPHLDDPLMREFIRLGTQFIGYRDTVDNLKEALAKANK
ncbi:uncharacterized protein [Lolium perenne]|uniref:uncharacterized protein n=1 Tax=Lolium perenne TaxID=4522 RepID=UPI0021F5BB70|nr:uncharacterized protein LOC127326131 [Lolium perenne]